MASSDKPQAFDPKQMSSQIVAELSTVIAPRNDTISAMSRQRADFYDAHLRKIVRDEFRGLAHSNTPARDELGQRRSFVGQTLGRGGSTPLCDLNGDVRPDRVWFSGCLS